MEWSKTNLALIDLYTRYPNPGVLNHHAILACLAGDKPATAALLRRIGARPDRAWWKFWRGEPLYERCKAWASEGTARRSNEILETLWQQRDLLSVLPLDVSRHIDPRVQYVCEL